ncbi:hypothetical protein RhiJN_17149 [Ceratobasidium sp. AG-Ba]|nr:hypothetical protein RhiJN_17149 [Ceratobasidium sp. AG-Ba]
MVAQGAFNACIRPKRVRKIPKRAQQHFSKSIQIGDDGVAYATETPKTSTPKPRARKKPKLEADAAPHQDTPQPPSPKLSESERLEAAYIVASASDRPTIQLDPLPPNETSANGSVSDQNPDSPPRITTESQMEIATPATQATPMPMLQYPPSRDPSPANISAENLADIGRIGDAQWMPITSPSSCRKEAPTTSVSYRRNLDIAEKTSTIRFAATPVPQPKSPLFRYYRASRGSSMSAERPGFMSKTHFGHNPLRMAQSSDPAEQVEHHPPSRSAAHLLFQPSTGSLSMRGGSTERRSLTPESRASQETRGTEVEETEPAPKGLGHNKQDGYEEPYDEDMHDQLQHDIPTDDEAEVQDQGEEKEEAEVEVEADVNSGEDEIGTKGEAHEQSDDLQTNTYLRRTACSRYETKRQQAQLRKFGKFQPFVARLAERILIRAIAEHGYADLVSAFTEPDEAGEVLHAGTLFDCWAWEEWKEVNLELRPNRPVVPLCAEYKIFARRVFTQLRNTIKAKIFAAVLLCFNLLPGLVDPVEVKENVRNLLDDAFHSPNLQYPDKYPFHHPVIALSIRMAHFGRIGKSIGFQYANKLGPIPLPTIALHTTIIHHIISLFGDGEQKDNALHADHQAEYFEYYLDYLEEASSPSKYKTRMTNLTNNMFNFCYSRALNNRPKMEGKNGRVYESDSEEEYVSPHVRRQRRDETSQNGRTTSYRIGKIGQTPEDTSSSAGPSRYVDRNVTGLGSGRKGRNTISRRGGENDGSGSSDDNE